jgi:molybdopterin-containing oxidoreductase family membrane subunit
MRPDLIKRTADPLAAGTGSVPGVDWNFTALQPGQNYGSVTDKIAGLIQHKRISMGWAAGVSLAATFVMILTVAAAYLFVMGVGIWGINMPVAWGFAIINFVWWVGIGHAGTFISAMLLLMRQDWRTSINRFAEAMTLFAVACAGMFPLLHMGRPWYFYWLMPYTNTMLLWPQFKSPLVWDDFGSLLVHRPDPRLGEPSRSLGESGYADRLGHGRVGLAKFRPALASVSDGVSAARCACCPAGDQRA